MSEVDKARVHLPATSHVLATRRIAALEAEVAELKDALASRERIGVAIGVVAERYRLSPERAWALLVQLSQTTNTKVRDIARLIVDGATTDADRALAERLNAVKSPRGQRLVP